MMWGTIVRCVGAKRSVDDEYGDQGDFDDDDEFNDDEGDNDENFYEDPYGPHKQY